MPQGSLQLSKHASLSLEEFLCELKSALAAEGLPFCVLRNYSGFPTANAGNDIDLLLEPRDLPRAVRALRSIHGIQAIAFLERPYVANLFFHGVAAHPDSESIEIDFDLSLSWKGLPFLAVDEVLRNARPRAAGKIEFLIPAPEHEAIISLFVSLLLSGFVKEKYLPDVQSVFISAGQQVHLALAPRFGDAVSRQVIDAVISADRSRIRNCIRPLRRALLLRAFCRQPAQTSLAIIRHYSRELCVRFSPSTATDIAIASADEALRTGVITALTPMLQPATVLLETQICPAGQKNIDASGSSSRIRIYPMLRCIVSGWIQKFAPKKHLTLRLHANRCFDWLVPQKTWRSSHLGWLARLANRLSPSPDLLIVLSFADSAPNPAGAKPAREKPRRVMLDSSRSIAQLAEEAYAAILALLAEKAAKRIRRFA